MQRLKEIMTPSVEVVTPETTLQEAAQMMRDLDVGPLPVCDGDALVGMVTDRDITVRAVAEGKDPQYATVREVMTDEVYYVYEDQTVEEAATLMAERQVRRLPVLSREERLTGIISLGDLAVETGEDERTGEVLEEISQPAEPDQ